MARYVDAKSSRKLIDSLVDEWKQSCLLESGSLLFSDRAVWTAAHLNDLRERLVVNPILGADQSFGQKLAHQLDTASDDVKWLAVELLTIYFLISRGGISPSLKKSTLKAVAPGGQPDPAGWQRIIDTMDEGIANPGVGYNINRDQQLGYLIDFCLRFKAIGEQDKQRELLDDPWKLRDFADDVSEGIAVREMRHVVLHLLRPDDFERISSRTHKRNIVDAFAKEFLADDVTGDVDEQLLMIRKRLVELAVTTEGNGDVIDFYYPPLRAIWDPGADQADGSSDLDLFLYKKQMVLFGAPGTGKTYRTRQLADQIIRRVALEKWGAAKFFTEQDQLAKYVDANTHWVQLHPGYGYEDFIRGLRLAGDGSTVFVAGLLPRLVAKMTAVPEPERLPVVLVLDEINRCDVSRLFGEAFSLLENRGSSVLLPGIDENSEPVELALPDNLYVIGTMNLIDQSVEELDFALRRRFFWRPVTFDSSVILAVNEERWATQGSKKWGWDRAVTDMTKLAEHAELLNKAISASPHLGPQYELGQSYYFDTAFFVGNWLRGRKSLSGGVLWTKAGAPRPPLTDLWRFSLEPLVMQYLAGLDIDVATAECERLKAVLMTGKEA
ncbi:AAA family ATPase [Mycolicibacterium lutetiense]|uniref:5-methylcytosine-specific restriction protein B n=1 Tax=Mycolicibacterium lutetiense TaxID=1641992 RepID=A0ABS4ZXD7_9MYCO|nr:AAA family ATPase [Mycolicibacterium lutetiense]MBP2454125.1 5-methylcytosine-specific restriction protein B [Mycolicibacterium lutetiense]